MKIALTGNPNSGKTTMYNALTGRSERVGNWAGVTVERKEYPVRRSYTGGAEIIAVDLPGAYSISPFTSEESITSDYIRNENPDVIVNIVDATNLSRSLFFTTQLMELGIPMVVALNKSDINVRKQTAIDHAALAEKLGCPVIETVSTSADGLARLIESAVLQSKEPAKALVQPIHNDRERFAFVDKIVSEVEMRKIKSHERNVQDRIDLVLTHPVSGILIFAAVMFLVFDLSQSTLGPWLADTLAGWIERFQSWVGVLMETAHPLLQALIVDGVIGGVGAVVGFLPLVMVMYFFIALLEDCGYMARVSVVLDPVFQKVGLSGKSVIPFVIGTGCAIPGVMACRTIRNVRERRAAAMLTPFMPCGAKLPVIALFSGVFFGDASWVGTLMYFVGIFLIFAGALIIRAITGGKGKKNFFVMELPEYKLPSLKRAFLSMCSRGWAYIVKAGTIILLCNTAVQIMQSFTFSFTLVEEGMAGTSILASLSRPFAFLLIPLGFGVWQMAAAVITGFIAKENVVGTLAVCYGVTNFIDTEELMLVGGAGEVAGVFALTKAAALACLMFNLFTPPCFAALGAMNSELNDRKWFLGGVALQIGVGYILAFFVYQIGTLIATGSFGSGFLGGLIAVSAFLGILTVLIRKGVKA